MVRYFKLINGQSIVGVANELDFLALQKKHNVLLLSNTENGQYISVCGVLYRDTWMKPVATNDFEYKEAKVVEIDSDEYENLSAMIEDDTIQDVVIETPDEIVETITNPDDEITLDFAKEKKMAVLKNKCQELIFHGVDVELSNGETKHFSLTIEDQLNLSSLVIMINQGMTLIPYHADGELCVMFPIEDIQRIVDAATQWKTYHITYFNSLKNYVNSLQDVDDVFNISYGIQIPKEFCSDVLIGIQNA